MIQDYTLKTSFIVQGNGKINDAIISDKKGNVIPRRAWHTNHPIRKRHYKKYVKGKVLYYDNT